MGGERESGRSELAAWHDDDFRQYVKRTEGKPSPGVRSLRTNYFSSCPFIYATSSRAKKQEILSLIKAL